MTFMTDDPKPPYMYNIKRFVRALLFTHTLPSE